MQIAYFELAPDAAFGIVHRPWFESRLRAHLEGRITEDDPSWYALQNTIYAYGCRLELSKRMGFRDAYQASWGWFENALSAHTEILYFQTSLIGVQALAVMVCYSNSFPLESS
jgi:hypothetical protein